MAKGGLPAIRQRAEPAPAVFALNGRTNYGNRCRLQKPASKAELAGVEIERGLGFDGPTPQLALREPG